MKYLPLLFALVLLVSCSKESVHNRHADRVDFFADEKDALCKIQRYATGFGRMETVEKILSVSYIDSDKKSYAFVFYQSDMGQGNLVVEQEYANGMVLLSRSIKCEGESCSCKVRSIIDDDGHVTLDCNCSSCTMIIH